MQEEKPKNINSGEAIPEKNLKKHKQRKERDKLKKKRRRSQRDEIKQKQQADADYQVTQPSCQREVSEEKTNEKSLETREQTPKNKVFFQRGNTKKMQSYTTDLDKSEILPGQSTYLLDQQINFNSYVRPCDNNTDKLISTYSKRKESTFFLNGILNISQSEFDQDDQLQEDEATQYDDQGKAVKKSK